MTTLEIREWERQSGVALSDSQLRVLTTGDAFTVSHDPNWPGRWIVGGTRFVGVAQVGDLEIRVQPKVGVRRLVELLTASHGRIRWDDDAAPGLDETDDLLGVIAEAFATSVGSLMSRGLLQGYRQVEEALPAVRGRVMMAAQMSRRAALPLPVELTFDEFTFDVLENRLLATAARCLLRLRSLPKATRSKLRRLDHQLVDVSSLPVGGRISPPEVEFTRINERYRPSIALARLIIEASSLEESVGSRRGIGFLVDMDKVFEDIVGQGMQKRLQPDGVTVDLQSHLPLDTDSRLSIRPDLLTRSRSGDVLAVMDVKYKQPDQKAILTSDIYQAVVYANRFNLDVVTLVFASPPPFDSLTIGNVTVALDWVDLMNPEVSLDRLQRKLSTT